MLVKIEDTVYKVSWKHTFPVEPRDKWSKIITEKSGGSTRCTIEVIKDMTTNPYVTELVDTAVAFCHSNDQFNKSTGRKYSLRKALSKWDVFEMELPQDRHLYGVHEFRQEIKRQRKLFWEAYFKEHKQ